MFDKQLCKWIGKPEITLGDVVSNAFADLIIISFMAIAVLFLLMCVGVFTLIIASPIIQFDYNISAWEAVCTGIGTVVWVVDIYIIWNAIFSVKIATCPKKQ